MELPILAVRRETNLAIQVVLAEWPFLIAWIPKSCIRSDWALGDRGIVLEVVGPVAAEIEQESWTRAMQAEKWVEENKKEYGQCLSSPAPKP